MTRLNVRLGLSAVLAVGLMAAAVAAPADQEMRIFDVADLEPISQPQLRRSLWSGHMFRVRVSRESREGFMADAEEHSVANSFSAEGLGETLREIAYEVDEEMELEVQGTQIVVRGTAEAVQRAADAMAILRRAAGRTARVDVEELLLAPDIAVPAVLDDTALEALRRHDHHGGTRRLSLDLDPGCWRLAEAVTGTRRVIDADVEIAQDASIADPIVARVEEGLRVLARGAPLTDGRMVIRVIASTGSLADTPRRLALGQDELGELDLPEIDAGFVGTELVLAAGRAQTVVLGRPEAEQRVLVFRLDAAPMESLGGTLRALPTGAFSTAYPLMRLSSSDDPAGEDAASLQIVELDETRRLSDDFLSNEIQRVMEADLDEDRASAELHEWLLGGAYLLRGPEGSLDRAFAAVAKMERDVFKPVRLVIRLEHRSPDGDDAQVIGSVAMPVATSLPSAIAAYRQVAFVADYDVEVAEKAQISDPQVGAALAGILANATVAGAGHGAHVVRLELRVSAIEGPHGRGFGATDVGSMETVSEATRYVEARVRTTSAKPGEINLGPSPFDEGARLVAVITVE